MDSPGFLILPATETRQHHDTSCRMVNAQQDNPALVHALSCRALDHLFSVASPGSPEEEQLGFWHAQSLSQQWHRYSSNARCTDVGFLILQSVSSREAAEDPWQKWQEKRAVYPFSYPLPLPLSIWLCAHLQSWAPQAEGLDYKQLDSDTNFICLPPHPVPGRSPVTSSSYDGIFIPQLIQLVRHHLIMGPVWLSHLTPEGEIEPSQKMLFLLVGARF